MPKLKPNEQEEANRIIRAHIAAGKERQALDDTNVAARIGIAKSTFQCKIRRPETFTAKELFQISKVLKFTPVQAASIILGRDLTAKEIKDFILM